MLYAFESTLSTMNYGERLQEAMKASKTDRKALAKHLGVSVQAIGQVINGQTRALDAANHSRAAAFLGCDPIWLATGEGTRLAGGIRVAEAAPAAWPFKTLPQSAIARLPRETIEGLERVMAAYLGAPPPAPAWRAVALDMAAELDQGRRDDQFTTFVRAIETELSRHARILLEAPPHEKHRG